MRTTIAATAATLLVMGMSSAFADGGSVHADTQFTEVPGEIAHSLRYTRSVAANNIGHAVSFMTMGGQYAFPPGYKPYYDHADHVVTLRYAHRITPKLRRAGHAVSFMTMGGQYAFPPGYKPYYDRADHVVTLRYMHRIPTPPNYAHRVTKDSNNG